MNRQRTFVLLAMGFLLALLGGPPVAQATLDEAISQTNQAILELSDWPYRTAMKPDDLTKSSGSNVEKIKDATTLLTEALSRARAANASSMAIMKLEEAVEYGQATHHKETRLMAQGALFYLCKDAGGQPEDICKRVPKFGAYVAP